MNHFNFKEFLQAFETKLGYLFRDQNDINNFSDERGFSAKLIRESLSLCPLGVAIPEQFGGRGSHVKQCLAVLSAASYESLPLSLTFGINIALFLEPIAKYAHESVKENIFDRFLNQKQMGGLMITEPEFGSDALSMKTYNIKTGNTYKIKGVKHWQGLTGLADYWLIASRNQDEKGRLNRDIDFFICDTSQEKQRVVVEEFYDSLGLYLIPYGRNYLDIEVSSNHKLIPQTTGIKMMLDILHRSRMQFPGMGMGFIKRMLDEAISHCHQRIVGIANLLSMDQVQFQLSRIQAAYTICSAMCVRSSEVSGIEYDLSSSGLEANSMKAVVTDLMQESANRLVQLSGANGYRSSHMGGKGFVDSRSFQIFEGSNEMLYTQISESVIRLMRKSKQFHLYNFLSDLDLTTSACLPFKRELSFVLSHALSQRKLSDLGRIIGRIVSLGYVLELDVKGFRRDLIENCVTTVKQEVQSLICAFASDNQVKLVEDYRQDSCWMDFA